MVNKRETACVYQSSQSSSDRTMLSVEASEPDDHIVSGGKKILGYNKRDNDES